jgi:hypothetical protein
VSAKKKQITRALTLEEALRSTVVPGSPSLASAT